MIGGLAPGGILSWAEVQYILRLYALIDTHVCGEAEKFDAVCGVCLPVQQGTTPEIRCELPAASQVPFATEEEFCPAVLCEIDMAALTRITANAANAPENSADAPEIYKLTFG